MIPKEEALALADIVDSYIDGGVSEAEVEAALSKLWSIDQYNVRENVTRFREAMKAKGPIAGESPRYWMLCAEGGIRGALECFTYPVASDRR